MYLSVFLSLYLLLFLSSPSLSVNTYISLCPFVCHSLIFIRLSQSIHLLCLYIPMPSLFLFACLSTHPRVLPVISQKNSTFLKQTITMWMKWVFSSPNTRAHFRAKRAEAGRRCNFKGTWKGRLCCVQSVLQKLYRTNANLSLEANVPTVAKEWSRWSSLFLFSKFVDY